ncbi:DUF4123 domain-containing protein [Scandinavium goeteborgense]|uniref:DUF4123 domain-containing protein n=1 Tax=Scandinavium goeteborgense TaxID=1851514 RepID=UPI002166AC81|nr:DUF4123 domain-containing protein [Scandinavium goeteborgense]MCS2153169.1 DUF4123 domain-containing protein [Scandinavium goeteborgense]
MATNNNHHELEVKLHDAVFGNNGKCFLIIDPTLERYHASTSFFEMLIKHNKHHISFPHQDLDGSLVLWLVSLDSNIPADLALFEASIAHSLNELKPENVSQGIGRIVCSWISTELSINDFSEQISHIAIQRMQNMGSILLRFFDPAVFGSLYDILDDWQRQQLLTNINAWCYLDGDGMPQIFNGDGGVFKKLNHSLGLTDSNLSKLHVIFRINRVLQRYRRLNIPEGMCERQASRILHPAMSYFLSNFDTSDEGYVDFGIDVLINTSRFYLNPTFEKYIKDTANNGLPLYHIVRSRIDKNMWEIRTLNHLS